MNVITGRNSIEICGVRRELACDMNAATVLYEMKGEHWTLWLIERFVGRNVKLSGGGNARRLERLSPAELIEVLYALMQTDREESGRFDDIKVLRKSIRLGAMLEVQGAVTRAVISSFGIPGRNRGRRGRGGRSSWKRTRNNGWNWHETLKTAFGLLGLSPAVFWRLTLAEWRAMLHGYDERQSIAMRKSAWVVSHLLIAAGCDADKVTISKLLGEKENAKRRVIGPDERKAREAEKLRKRLQRDKEKRLNASA